MTLNDLEWLFHDKMRFWPALLESERLNVRNSTTSILRYSVHFMIYMYLYLYSYRRETARQLRMYAQLTRCFSAVAELLVNITVMGVRWVAKMGSSFATVSYFSREAAGYIQPYIGVVQVQTDTAVYT